MPNTPTPPWKRGDRFSAKKLNRTLELANQVAEVSHTGENNTSVIRGMNGTSIINHAVHRKLALRLGVITDTGPSAAADYTDERYWVKPVFISSTGDGTDQITLEARGPLPHASGSVQAIDTVTNPAELIDHTHNLATDETIYVWYIPMFDVQSPSRPHYLIIGGVGGGQAMSWGKVVSNWVPADNNSITLLPCDAAGTPVPDATNVTVQIEAPVLSTHKPVWANNLLAGQVLPYWVNAGGSGLHLLHSFSHPMGSTDRQVQMTFNNHTVNDFPQTHS